MRPTFKPGDRVRVADRLATAQERKERKFFDHFRNLRGTIQRVYEDGEICLEVDRESLPEPIRKRQEEMEAGMKERWLNSLSEEAHRRLTEEEKHFFLRYSIIVPATDLVPLEPTSTPSPRQIKKEGGPSSPRTGSLKEEQKAKREKPASSGKDPRVRRLTEEDLLQAEEKALRQKRQEMKRGKGDAKPSW